MSFADLEWYKERWDYWHKKYQEANRRANSAVAEAKKSKERLITAIRMMQTVKAERDQFEDVINRIGVSYCEAETLKIFQDEVYSILQELARD